jgi:hypothetical protein
MTSFGSGSAIMDGFSKNARSRIDCCGGATWTEPKQVGRHVERGSAAANQGGRFEVCGC